MQVAGSSELLVTACKTTRSCNAEEHLRHPVSFQSRVYSYLHIRNAKFLNIPLQIYGLNIFYIFWNLLIKWGLRFSQR